MFNSFFILKNFLEDYERIKQVLSVDDLEEAEKIANRWGLSIRIVNFYEKGKTKEKIYLYPIEWNYNEASPPLEEAYLIE